MNNQRGILTIAIGKKYVHQAKYLALSAILHAPHLTRAMVTDCPDALRDYYDVCVPYNPEWAPPLRQRPPSISTALLNKPSILTRTVW